MFLVDELDLLDVVLLEMANGDQSKEKHVVLTIGKHGVVVGSINQTHATLTKALAEAASFQTVVWGNHTVNGHRISMVHLPGQEMTVKNCTGAGGGGKNHVTSGGLALANIHMFCVLLLLLQATVWSAALCTGCSRAKTCSRAATWA